MVLSGRPSRLALLFSLPLLLTGAQASFAQVPDAPQTACILAWNKAAGGVAKTSAAAVAACVKAAMKGKEPAPQACLSADAKGKIGKAVAKLQAVADGACADGAPFGFAGPVAGAAAAQGAPRELAASLFGDDLDDDVFVPGGPAACQSAMLKAAQGTLTASFNEFVACKKKQLGAGALASAAELDSACFAAISADAKGKVAKARAKIGAAAGGACASVVLGDALPGDCAAAPSVAACVDLQVRCATCRMIDGIDALTRDCDLYDDGVGNGSCATCGNGVVEAGETCDDGAANGEGCCSPTCGAANGGASCDDGDLCTNADTCVDGACTGGPVDCGGLDGDCTEGVCNGGSGSCESVPANNGATCDDGDACTIADTCSGGVCVGSAVDCSALDGACTEGVCNPGTGSCESADANEGLSCDDGDDCTDADACAAGSCVGSPVPPSSVVFEDHFTGVSLDPAWEESLHGFATGWTGSVHDSRLEVTDIANSTFNDWARVRFEQPVAATGDFLASFQVAWDSGGSNSPIQYMLLELLDSDGQRIALAEIDDSWAATSGNYVACDSTACNGTGQGSKPLAGAETFLLERIDGDLTITAGVTMLRSSTTLATAVTRVRVEVGFWRWSGGNFFGTISSDLVKLESLNTACTMP